MGVRSGDRFGSRTAGGGAVRSARSGRSRSTIEPNVADVLTAKRPKEVESAIGLLSLSVAIGALRVLLESSQFTAPIVIGQLVGLTVLGAMIYAIATGRNWARFFYVLTFVAGLPLRAIGLLASFEVSWTSAAVSLVQAGIEVYALYLLFVDPGKEWFRPSTSTRASF